MTAQSGGLGATSCWWVLHCVSRICLRCILVLRTCDYVFVPHNCALVCLSAGYTRVCVCLCHELMCFHCVTHLCTCASSFRHTLACMFSCHTLVSVSLCRGIMEFGNARERMVLFSSIFYFFRGAGGSSWHDGGGSRTRVHGVCTISHLAGV